MTERKLSEVFQTVGLPRYTYVKPSHFGEVRADIEQPGKHLLIEGPSGIGKTCVVYKVFEELGWSPDKDYKYVSCRDDGATDDVLEFVNFAAKGLPVKWPVLFIDDFHILPEPLRRRVGADLKRISDYAFEQTNIPKVIFVGIPAAGSSILGDAPDLGPRLGGYRIQRASNREIEKLIDEGEEELNILFEDRQIILSEASGNFWLAQYICNKICAMNDVHRTQINTKIIGFDLLSIRRRLMTELSSKFMPVARTFCKGKKWRPGGNKPYMEVLLALTKIQDSIVAFDNVLGVVPDRRRPGIKAIRQSIPEVIYNSEKGVDLRKQIAFEDPSFSIEDPLFRYFLSNLNVSELYKELGLPSDAVPNSPVYPYDVGFSFAGETRRLIEMLNEELKSEDIITFYDYDQQAFLLAENLEETLGRIYAESCRYYLVFLEENYMKKVWTRFERDILTNNQRSRHIIPVVLERAVLGKNVGISSTTGLIDISEQWKQIQSTNSITEDIKNTIRNRIVLPITEKIDSNFQDL